MFNFSPQRARASLCGRAEIISREVAHQWPHLVNDCALSDEQSEALAAMTKSLLILLFDTKRLIYRAQVGDEAEPVIISLSAEDHDTQPVTPVEK